MASPMSSSLPDWGKAHLLDLVLHAIPNTAQIRRDDFLIHRVGVVRKRVNRSAYPRVIEGAVQTPEVRHGLRDRVADVLDAAHVAFDEQCLAAFFGYLLDRVIPLIEVNGGDYH